MQPWHERRYANTCLSSGERVAARVRIVAGSNVKYWSAMVVDDAADGCTLPFLLSFFMVELYGLSVKFSF